MLAGKVEPSAVGIVVSEETWLPKPLRYPGPAMKTGIHPEYVHTHVRCSCGNEFETRSTQAEIHVDVCSACHPFYTGKQKLMDAGGRVERPAPPPRRPAARAAASDSR